jgi:glycerol-3-phosphate dehydrogenase
MAPVTCDLLIVGGGINGVAIAREAALNGWRVLLIERGDLAGETSSRSSGLIHGGLRYLEQYDFRLVAEALAERERTVRAAPHLVRPIRFVIPHVNAVRPWWLVRLGLVLYDLIGGKRTLARSRSLKKSDTAYVSPLKGAPTGFVYSDAQVDDARLVVLNAMDAAQAGAEIRTRTALKGATREGDGWHARLSDGTEVHARGLVNAAGPWVAETLGLAGIISRQQVRLVKGSHMVVPRLYEGDHAYLLQNKDRRIVFVLPWEGMTAIGTTDVPVDRAEDAAIDQQEIAYLCEVVSDHFARPVTPADVVDSWSGVRPLHDDGSGTAQTVSRDYLLELDGTALSVFGGKITTARHLAEEAVAKLAPALHLPFHPTTRARVLPGGMIDDPKTYAARTLAAWPFLGQDRTRRMVRAYGSLLPELLDGITDEAGMGRAFGAGLTEAEARWMHTREWARTAEDVLERRSKLGRRMTSGERAEFEAWWAETFTN